MCQSSYSCRAPDTCLPGEMDEKLPASLKGKLACWIWALLKPCRSITFKYLSFLRKTGSTVVFDVWVALVTLGWQTDTEARCGSTCRLCYSEGQIKRIGLRPKPTWSSSYHTPTGRTAVACPRRGSTWLLGLAPGGEDRCILWPGCFKKSWERERDGGREREREHHKGRREGEKKRTIYVELDL